MKLGFQVKEIETEQWFGSEWIVIERGGPQRLVPPLHTALSPFPRIKCYLWVLFHPSVWFA